MFLRIAFNRRSSGLCQRHFFFLISKIAGQRCCPAILCTIILQANQIDAARR